MECEHNADDIIKLLHDCLITNAPGFHCITAVVKLDRFTDEIRQVILNLIRCFGDEALKKYMIFVITNIDRLKPSQSLDNMLDDPQTNEALRNMITDASGRYIGINNTLPFPENEEHVKPFLVMIDKMTEVTQSCYLHNMFNLAEEQIQTQLASDFVHSRKEAVTEVIRKKSLWQRVKEWFLSL